MANKAKKLNNEELNAVSGGFTNYIPKDNTDIEKEKVTGAAFDSDQKPVTGDANDQRGIAITKVTEQATDVISNPRVSKREVPKHR